MAVTAETAQQSEMDFKLWELEISELPQVAEPDVYLASSTETDSRTRRRLLKLLGTVALEGTMSFEQEAAEQASLPAVVEDYFSDDPERAANGRARLRADLRSNTFEILRASGHVSQSHSKRHADGFYQ